MHASRPWITIILSSLLFAACGDKNSDATDMNANQSAYADCQAKVSEKFASCTSDCTPGDEAGDCFIKCDTTRTKRAYKCAATAAGK